jgi:hypothetical protein
METEDPPQRTLGAEADGLLRQMVGCGFTIAGLRGRHDVDAGLTAQLTDLLTVLDEAGRGIRRAVCCGGGRDQPSSRSAAGRRVVPD